MTRKLQLLPVCLLQAALAGAAMPGSVAPSKPAPSFDLKSYLAELDHWTAVAQRLSDHPEEAPSLRQTLPQSWPVSVEGQQFRVPTDWLRKELDDYPTDRAQAAARSREIVRRLHTLQAGAQSLPEVQPADAAAHHTLEGILARREFGAVKPPSPLRSWWDRAVDWVTDKLRAAFDRVGAHAQITAALVWILAAGLALLLATWLVRAALGAPQRGALDLAGPVAVEAWREWAARALASATRGDFREAIHLAYWASVYRLGETGLWQVDRARTPREYLRLVPAHHAQRPPLQALTRRFEHTWYGGEPASAEDFRGALTEMENLGCRLRWNAETASS